MSFVDERGNCGQSKKRGIISDGHRIEVRKLFLKSIGRDRWRGVSLITRREYAQLEFG